MYLLYTQSLRGSSSLSLCDPFLSSVQQGIKMFFFSLKTEILTWRGKALSKCSNLLDCIACLGEVQGLQGCVRPGFVMDVKHRRLVLQRSLLK